MTTKRPAGDTLSITREQDLNRHHDTESLWVLIIVEETEKSVSRRFARTLLTIMGPDLQFLFNDNTWETFVEEIQLSSLTNTLLIVFTCLFWKHKDLFPSETAILRKRTVKVIPEVTVKLSKHIALLRELANRADLDHWVSTVVNVAASFVGIASGVMSILAICLAPRTGDLSLELSAKAVGLGALATAVTVTISIVEQLNLSSIEAKANGRKTMGVSSRQLAMGVLRNNKSRISSLLNTLLRYPGEIMNWRVQVMGVVVTGLCVLNDVRCLVQDSKHLMEGAKTETAERMRLRAQGLDYILEEPNRHHDTESLWVLIVEETEKTVRRRFARTLLTVMGPDLRFLLNDDKAWETFVEEIQLSREEGEVLREGLRKHKILTATEGKEKHQPEQKKGKARFLFLLVIFVSCLYHYCTLTNTLIIMLTCLFWKHKDLFPSETAILRKRTVKVFPEVTVKLSKHIALLRELAMRADLVNLACTVVNVVASFAGLASGVMSILAFVPDPVTGDPKVQLSAKALGLGAVATAATVTTSIVEQLNLSSIEAKANGRKSMGVSPRQLAMGVLRNNKSRISSLFNTLLMYKHIHATHLANEGRNWAVTILLPLGSWLQRAILKPVETVNWRVQVMGVVVTGLCVLNDVRCLVQESKHLMEGAKTETAERMRRRAQLLDEILEESTGTTDLL
nr:unnamed protein product [Sorex araneus]